MIRDPQTARLGSQGNEDLFFSLYRKGKQISAVKNEKTEFSHDQIDVTVSKAKGIKKSEDFVARMEIIGNMLRRQRKSW